MSIIPSSEIRTEWLINRLSAKEGLEEDLITLYIPPNNKIQETIHKLRQEHKKVSEIKSKSTRKNYLNALERVVQELCKFETLPTHGLAIFSGAVRQNDTSKERLEFYMIEPPRSLNTYNYRRNHKFHLDPLTETLRENEIYGFILIDANNATIATLHGKNLVIDGEYHSGIGGKHKAGGESARRFERIRMHEINEYFKRIASHIDAHFMNIPNLNGLFVGGQGHTKYEFIEGNYINYRLQKAILKIVDTSCTGKSCVDEALHRASETLNNIKYQKEKIIIEKFIHEIKHNTGFAVYGENLVRKYLNEKIVDTIILSSRLNKLSIVAKCSQCDYQEQVIIEPSKLEEYEKKLNEEKCVNCLNQELKIKEVMDLVEEFIELGEQNGVKIKLISPKMDDNYDFLESFKGIAALLRYSAKA
ncbi:peptide chain release factor aRF-1 [[Eubacterium] cellulosolvens]